VSRARMVQPAPKSEPSAKSVKTMTFSSGSSNELRSP
jgi:hypothetical protein